LTGRTWKDDEAAAKLERAMENVTQLSEDEDEGGRKDTWGAPKARFRYLRELGAMGLFQQSRTNEDHGCGSTFTTP
jgi:hypothetical protein